MNENVFLGYKTLLTLHVEPIGDSRNPLDKQAPNSLDEIRERVKIFSSLRRGRAGLLVVYQKRASHVWFPTPLGGKTPRCP